MNETTLYYSTTRIGDVVCHDNVLERFIQYRMMAVNISNSATVPYLLDFMKTGNLWITDIYPEMWSNDKDRCKKLTSHEGIRIDFRKISNTSVNVFIRDFQDADDVMVISGSYLDEEDRMCDSRKLGLYRYFFNNLKEHLDFNITESEGMNAFFISKPGRQISDEGILAQYKAFKQRNR